MLFLNVNLGITLTVYDYTDQSSNDGGALSVESAQLIYRENRKHGYDFCIIKLL